MKKIILKFLIISILFNFIFCNNEVLADEATSSTFEGPDKVNETNLNEKRSSADENKQLNGEQETENENRTAGWDGHIIGSAIGIITSVINFFPLLLNSCMSTILPPGSGFFTIEQVVFNEIPIFNIDYFNLSSKYSVGTGSHKKQFDTDKVLYNSTSGTKSGLRISVSKYFIILRLISVAILLLVLIYIGIRMALSTLSNDKAKYKKMLVAWIEGVALLFLMQYIIEVILQLGKVFGNLFYNVKAQIDPFGNASFESKIYEKIYSFMMVKTGWTYFAYSVVYWILVFIQTKFFISYFRRQVVVGFLILISPLISVIFPIDKAGDGKSQSFSVWLNELCVNVFIQPIHAVIYIVFMFTAGKIAEESLFVGLIFLLLLTKVEKIILHLFDLKNVTSLKPVGDERKK